jgi:hypothetical protein
MTRWLRPHELERDRKAERFDPVRVGERYGLPRELALAIWDRVCADATDVYGRRDVARAEQRFHEIAARIAARSGRLRPDVGRLTAQATEPGARSIEDWAADERIGRTPGRQTLVEVQARRASAQDDTAAQPPRAADAGIGQPELPGGEPGSPSTRPLPPTVQPTAAGPLSSALWTQARGRLDPRIWAPPRQRPASPAGLSLVEALRDQLRAAARIEPSASRAPTVADATRPGAADARAAWDAATLVAQMRRTFGAAASDVPIATDSARAQAAGAEGVAIGEKVYIAPGYYDLTTAAGRERLGHEVAHVMQQRRGRDLPARLGTGDRAGLEAEADRAGHAFARGKPFAVQGRAPARIALFKGATPAKPKTPAAAMTTIDLKAGGRIERKPPASAAGTGTGTGSGASAAPAATNKPKAKEQLLVTYGGVQASNAFTVERDASGAVVKLVGRATLTLPASRYLKPLELVISLGADGTIGAKMQGNGQSTIKIGGLTVQGGKLSAAIDHGQLTYALDGANLALPKNLGHGALTIQSNGDKEPAFDASLAINVPKMQPATMSFRADANGYRAEGSTGVDFKQASGSVKFGLEKVGEDKALWSAAGSVGYTSERLSGQVSVQYNADGELSGEGALDFKIANFLTGKANVALDKAGHVTVNGEIRPPAEQQLFPEKKVEQTFLHKSLEFPIWGISIPMVGSVGLIAFIEGSMGYRVGVGAGVMRDIVLSGSYSTDPSVQPSFQITGEIFIPAYAELLISIGGGIKLDAFVAEVGGGIKVDGRAGIYGGLSVRPILAYENGNYRLMGQALLAGDVGLSAQVDAFVKLHVGKWMFSWEKEWDWKLGEWNKWLGLNLGIEADLDYTLGQPLSPDIFKLKKPDSLDVQGIAKSAMPQGGTPPQGPKGAQNQRADFKQKGGGAPASAPAAQPKVAGTPAGAAGHKNQAPKGKTVKPAKPPKSGPAKQAKGKTASQTGPDPKNKSKPTEQKLDTKPIVESFSMHGEPHQLIVQLGPSGHVDMASKRERLSVKVGHAVGKLIAKKADPQQVSDLKAIGEVAKKGDKMVTTARMPDKPGAAKVAQQIAAYGERWKVHDLDEVALVPFETITERPSMHANAKEYVQARPATPTATGTAELWIGRQKGTERLAAILTGPIGESKNRSGFVAVRGALAQLLPLIKEVEAVKVTQGKVEADKLPLLRAKAQAASSIISALGLRLKTNSLEGANHARQMKTEHPVSFKKPDPAHWKKPYIEKFIAEMVKQLRQQQTGMNKLTLDEWVINREKFSPTIHLNELDSAAKKEVLDVLKKRCEEGKPRAEKRLHTLQTKKPQLDAALAALQSVSDADPAALKEAMKKAKEAASDVQATAGEIQGYIDALPQISTGLSGGKMDTGAMKGAGGREDGQAAWARKHKAAKEALVKLISQNDGLVAEWKDIVEKVGDLAVLHDPDQIAGGHGDIPPLPVVSAAGPGDADGHAAWRKYLADVKAHLGVLDVNSSLGSQWKNSVEGLYKAVLADPDVCQEAYGILKLKVKLVPV